LVLVKGEKMDERNRRKMNLVRFGLTLVSFVAWAMVITPLFLISNIYKYDLDFTS